MKVLEIVCLENGDVVLVESASETDINNHAVTLDVVETDREELQEESQEPPLVSIRFSPEVRDMLGDDTLGVAEAMIEAATAYISDEADSTNGDFGLELTADRTDSDLDEFDDHLSTTPVVLH